MNHLPRSRLPLPLAEALGRGAGGLARLTRLGAGSSLPGRVILALDPAYIARRASRFDRVVVVSGTNGKTTTAAMIQAILVRWGERPAQNASGANLAAGVAAAMLTAARGARTGVFEIDEGALRHLVAPLRPAVLVLTNIFRDQLDRFGEPERVGQLLRQAASALPAGATLVANADDPALWHAVEDLRPVGFGVRQPGAHPGPTVAGEPEICPVCGAGLTFDHRTMANLGSAACPRCGWRSASPDVQAEVLRDGGLDEMEFSVGDAKVTLPVGGLHNVYNAAAAIAAATAIGVPVEVSVDALLRFVPRFGRSEAARFEGRDLWLALMKNPAGAGAVLRSVATDPTVGSVVIAVSDLTADGRDISWIWDAEFEQLIGTGLPVIPGGRRAADVAVRLKYAGLEPEPSASAPGDALRAAGGRCPPGKRVAVLATYTAMLDLRGVLSGNRSGRVTDREAAS